MKKKFESKFLKAIRKFVVPIAFCLIFAMVWNSIPVTAEVSDNLQDAAAHILGQRNDQLNGAFKDASTNAKLNKMQEEIGDLSTKINNIEAGSSSLSSLDFATIKQMCKAGTISKVVHPGDNLYDSEGHRYIVLGINEDVPCDSHGNNTSGHTQVLTLLFADGFSTAKMNASDSNIGGWASSDMRKSTMKTFVDRLPDDVRGVIGLVKTDKATADNAFLLSRDEVFNGGYSYFTNSKTRNLNNGSWWLRDYYPNNTNSFYYVSKGRDDNNCLAANTLGVFPAICIY